MRRPHLHLPTFVCALRGHCAPAASAARLRPQDSAIAFETDSRRMVRCLRCDAWLQVEPPAAPVWDTLPPLKDLDLPRRDKALREAVVLRLIAVDRGLHSVIFGLVAAALAFLELRLAGVQHWAQSLIDRLESSLTTGGQGASRSFFVRSLNRLLNLHRSNLRILLVTALVYCVIEGTEAVGLWLEKRWAEYLTAVATAGFLPFEIDELTKRVTVLRLATLAINLAVLVYLVWRKHLFGIARAATEDRPDPDEVFAAPSAVS